MNVLVPVTDRQLCAMLAFNNLLEYKRELFYTSKKT